MHLGLWIQAPKLLKVLGAISGYFGSISNIKAIALGSVVLYQGEVSERLVRHESTHISQQMVFNILTLVGWVGAYLVWGHWWIILVGLLLSLPYLGIFYIWYGVEYLIRLIVNGGDGEKAYRELAFEKHAVAAETNQRLIWSPLFWLTTYFR